jgi:hypothetical protein
MSAYAVFEDERMHKITERQAHTVVVLHYNIRRVGTMAPATALPEPAATAAMK